MISVDRIIYLYNNKEADHDSSYNRRVGGYRLGYR